MALQRKNLANGYAIGVYIPDLEFENGNHDWQHFHYVSKLKEWVVLGGYYTKYDGREIHAFKISTSQNFTSYHRTSLPPVLFETEQEAEQFIRRHLMRPDFPIYSGMYPVLERMSNGDSIYVGFEVVPVSSRRALQSRSNCIKVRAITDKDWYNLNTAEVWAAVQPNDRAVRDCPEYLNPNAPGPGVDAPVEEPEQPEEPTHQYRGFNFGESLNNRPKNNLVEAIKTLLPGKNFWISRRCNSKHGVEVLIVKEYKPDKNGFELGFVPVDKAIGPNSPAIFDSEESAQNYIDDVLNQQPDRAKAHGHYRPGWDCFNGYPGVSQHWGTIDCYRIPIADYGRDIYVDKDKFSQSKLDQLAELCPMYFGPDRLNSPFDDELEIDLDLDDKEGDYNYRGFNFNK